MAPSRVETPQTGDLVELHVSGSRRALALLNAPDTATKRLRDRAIIAVLRGGALRRWEAAALTDGRSSGGFTPEATGDARHANAPELPV